MREEYMKWYSPTLGKDIEMLIFGDYGLPIIIFPTTKGKYYESKDFKLIDSVAHYIEQGKIKVYCPDSVDALSLYNRNIHPADRIKNHILYDRFIADEIINSLRSSFNIQKVGVAGASFGGYHALNFAFRHPDMVSLMISMSGAYDISSFMDGFHNDDVYFNSPNEYISGNNHPDLWKMKIILGIGEWDICKDANLHMSHLLSLKGIDHWLDEWKWAKHDWPLWRDMFPRYIDSI